MDGYRIGQLQLLHLGHVIADSLHILKDHHYTVFLLIDHMDIPDISVKNPFSLRKIIGSFPFDLIIIAGLHHLVPFPEQPFLQGLFSKAGSRGIQSRLQMPVQAFGSQKPFFRRRQNLEVPQGIKALIILRQPGGAKLQQGIQHFFVSLPLQEEKILVLFVDAGIFSAIDPVGVDHDQAFLGLAEDLIQPDRMHQFAFDNVPEDISRSHRGQLIRISHQNQPGSVP